jgi:hypothetical protein
MFSAVEKEQFGLARSGIALNAATMTAYTTRATGSRLGTNSRSEQA